MPSTPIIPSVGNTWGGLNNNPLQQNTGFNLWGGGLGSNWNFGTPNLNPANSWFSSIPSFPSINWNSLANFSSPIQTQTVGGAATKEVGKHLENFAQQKANEGFKYRLNLPKGYREKKLTNCTEFLWMYFEKEHPQIYQALKSKNLRGHFFCYSDGSISAVDIKTGVAGALTKAGVTNGVISIEKPGDLAKITDLDAIKDTVVQYHHPKGGHQFVAAKVWREGDDIKIQQMGSHGHRHGPNGGFKNPSGKDSGLGWGKVMSLKEIANDPGKHIHFAKIKPEYLNIPSTAPPNITA